MRTFWLTRAIDIATGYFEIGAFLCLKDRWRIVEQFWLLIGDEVSFRTKRAFENGLRQIKEVLSDSLESEKAKNDFLEGVPAIVEAIREGEIQCRVYRKDKFHAKAYLTHGRSAVVGSFGLVGSSNFTHPGLNDNVELNVQIRGPEVGILQEWYERHWVEAEDITPDILRCIERHTSPHTPFEIWFKALHEFFSGHELTPDEWDTEQSVVFRLLAKYQRDAYKNLVPTAARMTMWSLTLPQVAATLAATLVAFDTRNPASQRLIDNRLLNVVLVLMVTISILGPVLTEHFAPRLLKDAMPPDRMKAGGITLMP